MAITVFMCASGFLYTFIGTIGLEQYTAAVAETDGLNTKFQYSTIQELVLSFMALSGSIMVAVGCVYFVMGVFCLQGLRNMFQNKYEAQIQEYKEMSKGTGSNAQVVQV